MDENDGPPKIATDSQETAVSTLPKSLSTDQNPLGELIDLTPEQEDRLKKFLKARLTEWQTDTEDLHDRLKDDNDLVEGVVYETDFPWAGASNVHMPVAETYMEVYKSVEKRSILGADLLWYGETDDDNLRDMLPDVEEMMNYKARNEWNIENCLENVFWTTNRDGLGVIEITWAEEYEKARDLVLITNEDEFIMEFPSPEDAGVPEETYNAWRAQAAAADEQDPLEIPITFDKCTYFGNKGEVIELADFVTIPASVKDIKDEACRGYGKRFTYRRATLRKKAKDKVFYSDAVKRLLNKPGRSGGITDYVTSKDEIEGISRTNTKDDFPLFQLVIKGRLNGEEDDEEEKFLVTYSLESNELVGCMYFPYRMDHYALFKINGRPNRLIGRSLPVKVRDINDEIDTQHNQRINGRTIASVPSFKAQANKKEELDPELQMNKWKPGVIFWLTDFEAFDQFKVQPTDQGESLAEEQNSFKILDLYLGSAVALLSGSTAPGDPSAPGNKTAIMIQQSNLRMDDPLSELRDGVNQVGEICMSHLYQFGPPLLDYQSTIESQGGNVQESRTVHKKYLRRGIKLKMKGVTVINNPDSEMQKLFQLYQTLMLNPTFQQNPKAQLELLSDALRAGRVAGRRRYLPSMEELQQQMVQMQQQAMMQQQQQAQQAQQQAQAESVKANLAKAGQENQLKTAADKIATRSLELVNGPSAALSTNANGATPNAATQ